VALLVVAPAPSTPVPLFTGRLLLLLLLLLPAGLLLQHLGQAHQGRERTDLLPRIQPLQHEPGPQGSCCIAAAPVQVILLLLLLLLQGKDTELGLGC